MSTKMNIPFSPPDIGEEEIAEVVDSLRSGWITTGPKTKLFEKQISELCHTNKTIALSSATDAMEMALRLLDIKEGDEVITTAYTYTATTSVIYHVGATPIMIDIQKNSFEMDYDKLEQAITEKTKAIIPVDIGGVMCDYDRIFEIIERKKSLFKPNNDLQSKFGRIIVIADSAHGIGAQRNGKMSGEYADFTSFSFHAVKNLTTAEGGALTWRKDRGLDDEEIYKDLQLLSLHGQTKDALKKSKLGDWEYDIMLPAYKCNMPDIMAAIGLAQMRRYSGMVNRRHEIIKKYEKALEGHPVELLNHEDSNSRSSGHLFIVRVKGIDVPVRNEIIVKMGERGIATNVHYKPLPLLTAYKNLGFDIKDYPNSYDFYKEEITLPLYTLLTDEQVDYIISNFIEVLGEYGK